MKKSTVKAAKTTASAKKAPAKLVKKAATAPSKRATVPEPKRPAPKPPALKAPAANAPAVKAPEVKTPVALAPTVISALIDVGYGNRLYLRGEGPGLSWDMGVPMNCVADDKWSISLPGTGKPVVYKFLINDLSWSAGHDYVVQSGTEATVAPTF